MKTRGPAPLSRAEHELRGTYRPDRHGKPGETFDADGEPEKPAGLEPAGVWLWDFIVGDLQRKRVVAKIDTAHLTALCQWYASYAKYRAAHDALEPLDPATYRLLVQMSMCWKAVESLSAAFGLNPASRARLRIPEKPPEQMLVRRRDRSAK